MQDQINKIARRMTRWAYAIGRTGGDLNKTAGYCMSGTWQDFYQRFLFPEKSLSRERLDALVTKLRELGYKAELEAKLFENGNGAYAYMRMQRISD